MQYEADVIISEAVQTESLLRQAVGSARFERDLSARDDGINKRSAQRRAFG